MPLAVPAFALVVWGIIDAATRPSSAWAAIETSQALWIGLMAGGLVLCYPVGLVFAIYYLVSVRARLSELNARNPRR